MGARELDSIESVATLAVDSANPTGSGVGGSCQDSDIRAETALSTNQDRKL